MKRFILLSACTALMGCATAPPHITSVNYQLVVPAPELLKNCIMVAPPNVKEYATATVSQKETMLYNFSMAELTSLAKCNKQWESLRAWQDQQKLIYKIN
jgi:hypothetical protein